MFESVGRFWESYGFEILLVLSIAFIIIYGCYRIFTNQKGSWSTSYYITDPEIPGIRGQEVNGNKPKQSKGELECKNALERIFKVPFDKTRPDFLRNPVTGNQNNLELDCYNDRLRLAIEYNGIQHYKYNNFFHKNYEHFLNQKYRDELKRRLCRENNILLIEVPYTVKTEQIESYLRDKLRPYFNV